MSRASRRRTYLRHIAMLVALPLVLMGTGFALFSRNLSISTTLTKPAYSSSQYIYMTYNRSVTAQSSVWLYTISPMTVINKGVTSVTAWQVKFDVPTGASAVTCPASVTCTRAGNTVTIVNGAGNGAIAAGASITFNISFTAPTNNSVLQNIITSGTLSTAFQNVAGLTVSPVAGTRTKKGKTYTYPYTFTVTNNSGQNLSAWQITATWSLTTTVASMSATVTYTTNATTLTITSTAAIANGANFVFNGSFSTTNATWTLTGVTIRGRA